MDIQSIFSEHIEIVETRRKYFIRYMGKFLLNLRNIVKDGKNE